jgi:hypothetical protein
MTALAQGTADITRPQVVAVDINPMMKPEDEEIPGNLYLQVIAIAFL